MRQRFFKDALRASIILIFCLSLAPYPGEAAEKPEILLKKADGCRKSLLKTSSKMKYRHNWMNCIKEYENIQKIYPDSEQAIWALYHSAGLHEKLYRYSGRESDLDEAIKLYQKLTDDYPDHRLADDSQYKIGDIYCNIKDNPAQAYVEYLKVDIKFPSGDMRPKARAMMDRLAVQLGKTETTDSKGGEEPLSRTGLTAVKNIRHWSTPTYTRVVLDLENPVKYTSNLLKRDPDNNKPRRLYLDLEGTYVSSEMESIIPIKDGLLQQARAGQYDKTTVRVVLDIENIAGYKTFYLHDPFRIVVDVRGEENDGRSLETNGKIDKREVGKGIKKGVQHDKDISLARQLGLSVGRIIIDPGHGGKDPGTYYKGGIKEKDIVLKLAKGLAKKIEGRIGCEVLLTRSKDEFLPLDERTAFANVKKGDIFISIHINAHKQKSVFGVETYFLNMATDERAVMVAARENATSEKNISDLQSILNDLMLNTKITESSRLAHEVQKGMMSRVKSYARNSKSLGVKQAPFYVLIGAEMPAILVEAGFITNDLERSRLLDPKYLELLSDGIVSGIESYIKSIDQAHAG
ncbi:MAG: N-acetylmuramoyl-L-alanine amidase [Deltaproteobacteria bacterium]|nr:N-acetylmuramoyl-L-alanine amidase [Deltaproteobacteria bacterium]